ncbi:MAG: trypsin-like peptidase domain-containing protein [Planctomycetia bacterium]|nr:trypsin-like peptidase domain-containing protein [Planctomycetia bacterium]
MTPLVKAVQGARPSIVNIHGEKVVANEGGPVAPGERRRVNGMGTGIVIDERGYIITNHHVVDGVRKILVTTHDEQTYIATMISHDPKTDLAIIKIDAPEPLPVMKIGTSADLMTGETVIAVGNAFGYEHTVTQGIISALHRSVQVSDTQSYEDLIQTDASINPGNSGGPLLNIDGEMVGINVAVRAGAQGIGFSIPVDKALNIATDLLSTRRIDRTWHGMVVEGAKSSLDGAVLKEVLDDSPAALIGLRAGDIVKSVASTQVQRVLDIERGFLGKQPGSPVEVTIERDHKTEKFDLVVASVPDKMRSSDRVMVAGGDRFWSILGLKMEPVPQRQFQSYRTRYRGGLVVTDVKNEGPAAKQGIRRGDILVGMHIWETVTVDNVNYILDRPDFATLEPVKFYIVRGTETLFGHMSVARNTQ